MAENIDSFDDDLLDIEIPILEVQNSKTPVGEKSETTEAGPSSRNFVVTNKIMVHPNQKGNPLLAHITKVQYEFEDIVPDYIVSTKTCIIFISLKYHLVKPDYIRNKIRQLKNMFELRVLLVQVDMTDPHKPLRQLMRMCLLCNLTLMLAWGAEEAGFIIENYKLLEKEPVELIKEQTAQNIQQIVSTALTSVGPVNKSNAAVLYKRYHTLKNLVNASKDSLSRCPGMGNNKATQLYNVFNAKFIQPR